MGLWEGGEELRGWEEEGEETLIEAEEEAAERGGEGAEED